MNELSEMKLKDLLFQIESIKDNSQAFLPDDPGKIDDDNAIWKDDVDACTALIEIVKALWDVLTYEDRLESPIRILAEDNERLKEENNELLKKLGKTEKYREQRRCKSREPRSFKVGDKVFSKILNATGEVTRVDIEEKSACVKFKIGHSSGKMFTCSFAELRKV